ncbi:MAG: mucoidy inhibitor MuiA family protein [Pirellulales bacterium]
MRMRDFGFAVFSLIVLATAAPKAGRAEVTPVTGRVSEVTVYQGQALVTRAVDVPGAAGLHEIVITDLPEHILPGSLYAESAGGVEVRSVRYRVRPVEQDVREEVRKLDEQIQATADAMQATQRQQQLLAEQTGYLAKLEQFVAPTANAELTKGVLNAETLETLSQFIFNQRRQIAEQELKHGLELRGHQQKLELLQRQRNEIASGSARAVREAAVFVNLQNAGGALRLRYLVNNANWSPSYNVRAALGDEQVTVEYNASIEQMSGENWNDVAMTLSTASPSLMAMAPVLNPLTISLGPAEQLAAMNAPAAPTAYFDTKKDLDQRRAQVVRDRALFAYGGDVAPQAQAAGVAGGRELAEITKQGDLMLNSVAGELQMLDLMSQAKLERKSLEKPQAGPSTEGVSVSYVLPNVTSLPSRADRQLIQIASLPMKGDFYRVAIPVLTSFVYREASVINQGQQVLLAGPVSTYVGGQFVGRGDLPTVAVGQRFTVGLGIDTSLRASRQLVRKGDTIQGGNRVAELTYEIEIENFGPEAAEIRLLDRLPTAKESEVKLTLVSAGADLSSDDTYRQTERKKGILRWDVKVPAQATGLKAFRNEYKLQMEYDKQLAIANLPAPANAPPAPAPR